MWSDFVDESLHRLIAAAPLLIGVFLTLIAGLIIAVGGRYIVKTLLQKAFEQQAHSADRFIALPVISLIVSLLPAVFFWLVILVTFALVSDLAKLDLIASWMNSLLLLLPRLAISAAILLAGFLGGRWLHTALETALLKAQVGYAGTIGKITEVASITFAGVIAFEQIGIDLVFFTTTLEIILAGLLLAGALAFGLGSRSCVENILGLHYVRKTHQVGDSIQLDKTAGVIAEFHATCVEIRTDVGKAFIPGHRFATRTSQTVAKSP